MITDGGPEFRGDFSQSGEYAGISQVIIDVDAPWQNGECERPRDLSRTICQGPFGKRTRNGSRVHAR